MIQISEGGLSEDPLVTRLSILNEELISAVNDLVNLYVYVANDPLNISDLKGLGEFIDRITKNDHRQDSGASDQGSTRR